MGEIHGCKFEYWRGYYESAIFFKTKIIMENTCGYSDDWQPYIGDYDKFEYDVKLKDGTILENCYPNGGIFGQMDSDKEANESEVEEIRFSNNPISFLNNKHSKFEISKELVEQIEKRSKRPSLGLLDALPIILGNYHEYADFKIPNENTNSGPKKYCTRWIDIRTEPKIGRNDVCPKCDSGNKFKKCCGKN